MGNLRTIINSGHITAVQPLAHGGGKNSGTVHTFRRETIFGEDGTPYHAIPSISGGTIRYTLRSIAAKIMHDFLVGDGTLPFSTVHAMHNGGAMKETKSVKELITGEKQAILRETVPLFGVFGGMGGARAISGRLDVDSALPITQETAFLGDYYEGQRPDHEALLSAYELVQRLNYGRFSTTEGSDVQPLIDKESERELPKGGGMLFWSQEVLPVGTKLWHSITLNDATPVEASFFNEVLSVWKRRASIGQQRRVGMGKIMPHYTTSILSLSGAESELVDVNWRTELQDRKEEGLEALLWL